MDNYNNKVITLLYDALVLVRYPGIAQVDIQNFKTCILSENNRFLLLRWLYIQGINKINNLGYKSLNYSQETEETNTLAFDESKFFILNLPKKYSIVYLTFNT